MTRREALKALVADLDDVFDKAVAVAAANAREAADRAGHKWRVAEREAFRAALNTIITEEEPE